MYKKKAKGEKWFRSWSTISDLFLMNHSFGEVENRKLTQKDRLGYSRVLLSKYVL